MDWPSTPGPGLHTKSDSSGWLLSHVSGQCAEPRTTQWAVSGNTCQIWPHALPAGLCTKLGTMQGVWDCLLAQKPHVRSNRMHCLWSCMLNPGQCTKFRSEQHKAPEPVHGFEPVWGVRLSCQVWGHVLGWTQRAKSSHISAPCTSEIQCVVGENSLHGPGNLLTGGSSGGSTNGHGSHLPQLIPGKFPDPGNLFSWHLSFPQLGLEGKMWIMCEKIQQCWM